MSGNESMRSSHWAWNDHTSSTLTIINKVYSYYHFTVGLEFICAQSPESTKGLLRGLLYSAFGLLRIL